MAYVYLLTAVCLVLLHGAAMSLFIKRKPGGVASWALLLLCGVCSFFAIGCALMSSLYFSGVR